MPKASPIQTSFNAGELSPLLEGRVDINKYSNGCYEMQNMLATVQGPAFKRPGTKFIQSVKTAGNRTALIPFRVSRDTNYIIEVGDQYMRFYTNRGYIAASEIATVYAQADLFDSDNIFRIDYVQSGDVMYLVHPSYPIQKLTRTSATTFSIAQLDPTGGPFQRLNTGTNTIYASAETGSVTLTAGSALFTADMVGSLVYLQEQSIIDVEPWQTNAFYAKGDRAKSDGKNYEAFVNGGSEYSAKTITGITKQDPAVVTTSGAHGYSNGDFVRIASVGGMTELNDRVFEIQAVTSTTFELKNEDSTHYTTYTSGGTSTLGTKSEVVRPVHTEGEQSDGPDGVKWTYRDYGAGIVKITAFSSTTSVTATVVDRLPSGVVGASNASTRWALGKFSIENGFPEKVSFFRERLCFAKGQEIDFSVVGDFENFRATDFGEVTTESAFTVRLNSDRINDIEWLSPGDSLLAGTTGAEFAISEITTSETFGPTNSQVSQQSQLGSRPIKPIKINDSTLFIDASGLNFTQFQFSFESEQYRENELNILAEHITEGGLISSAYQQNPDRIIWFVRSDGVLISCTYNQSQDVTAWAKHVIGGTDVVVESIAVIPTPDGRSDELYLIVSRTIDGSTTRYIEYLDQKFSSSALSEDAWFVDSGLSLSYSATAISAITQANPAVVTTSAAHGLSNGESVSIYGVTGIEEIQGIYTVANATSTTFELSGFDSSGLPAYISGGFARRVVSTITGLSHLEGESVKIWADGATLPDETVSSGSITLDEPSSNIIIGLGYSAILTTMRVDAGAADGTSQGKTKRVNNVTVRLYRTIGLKYGPEGGTQDTADTRTFQDNFDEGIPLFTGDLFLLWPGNSEKKARLKFESSDPAPFTLIAIMPQLHTQDR